MAWDYYLNVEPLALRLAKGAAAQMTVGNYTGRYMDTDYREPEPDEEAFLSNFEHGFVTLYMVAAYYESSINSLLRDVKGFDPAGHLVQAGERAKLEVLFEGRLEELEELKGRAEWRDLHKAIEMRNALTHYKRSSAGFLSSYPQLASWKLEGVTGDSIGDFFTKSVLERSIRAAEAVVCRLADGLGATLNPDVEVLGCDAGELPCTYVSFETGGTEGVAV